MQSIVVTGEFGSRLRIFKGLEEIQVVETGEIFTLDRIDNIIMKTSNFGTQVIMRGMINAFTKGQKLLGGY